MNYLGLDLGEKRVGVAIAESELGIATPHQTVFFSGREQLAKELKKIIAEYRPEEMVVGFPQKLNGQIGPAAEKITKLVDWLKTQIPGNWILWDERLTTAEVERILLEADLSREKRKEVRDQLAAQRILQTYLDFKKNQKRNKHEP